ncbi:MAG: FAD-binding protein [Alphaproteobacteria bacterium]|nr:FAD-binding protein [Alphaproteobacteria bacterium]
MAWLLPNVALPDPPEEEALRLAAADHLGVPTDRILAVELVRRSLDARHGRQRWLGVLKVDLEGVPRRDLPAGVRPWTERDDARYGLVDLAPTRRATWPAGTRAVVVGAGPAGLFAALYLAEAGMPVLLLERGQAVAERVEAVNGHWRRRLPLDPENNLVFGEGGAGTFSDGKIYTRRRDGTIGYVLRRFVDFGARPGILEEGWAHLGTDKVRELLPVFRARLRELGAEVRFGARVDDLVVEQGRVRGVVLGDGSIERGHAVIVAAGHSARDTIAMLVDRGAAAEARPIAIGVRIEHPQAVIDAARYGRADRGDLPPASYRLAHESRAGVKARTFCMCPGGMVVPAANQPGRVVVNGMSFAAQRAFWANAAVIVEVDPARYGAGPLAGYAWQDAIEQRAFDAGGGDEHAPGQRLLDLLDRRPSTELPRASYPLGVRPTTLEGVLPDDVLAGVVGAVRAFDRRLPGYVGPDAVLVAPETRTTSPVRLLRDDQCASTSLPGLYPVGEGAGYGGGIVSCALDGLRAAEALVAAGGASA